MKESCRGMLKKLKFITPIQIGNSNNPEPGTRYGELFSFYGIDLTNKIKYPLCSSPIFQILPYGSACLR